MELKSAAEAIQDRTQNALLCVLPPASCTIADINDMVTSLGVVPAPVPVPEPSPSPVSQIASPLVPVQQVVTAPVPFPAPALVPILAPAPVAGDDPNRDVRG